MPGWTPRFVTVKHERRPLGHALVVDLSGFWTPPDAVRDLVHARPVRSGAIMLEGRAPLWIHAAAALASSSPGQVVAVLDAEAGHHVVAAGAERVGVVLGAPATPDGSSSVVASDYLRASRSGGVLRVEPVAHVPIPREVLLGVRAWWSAMDRSWPDGRPERVEIAGRMPAWLAVALACCARDTLPDAVISLEDPKLAGSVVVRSPPASGVAPGDVIPAPRCPEGHVAMVIGVVGHPNSGKSVFSWKLYLALQRLGVRSYRFDADMAAPTTLWSMGSDFGKNLRQRLKRPWNDAVDGQTLERTVLKLASSRLDVVLVDLPGGDHSRTPPDLVPALRAPVFAAIPSYIIVRRDAEIARVWRETLSRAASRSSVIAEVFSRRDGAAFETGVAGPGALAVHPAPLDRESTEIRDPAIDAFADWVRARVQDAAGTVGGGLGRS